MMHWFKETLSLIMALSSISIGPTGEVPSLGMDIIPRANGTIMVAAGFSNGIPGSRLPLTLETLDGECIKDFTLDENGEVSFTPPQIPYRIFLNGGPVHRPRETGLPPSKRRSGSQTDFFNFSL